MSGQAGGKAPPGYTINDRWEMVIGLEVHIQLKTASKLFSATSTEFGASPNEHTNVIDLALPGALPVLNRSVISCAIRFGLAVDGEIAEIMEFDRKHYFYPDLPKGYQISQLDRPAVSGGQIAVALPDGAQRNVRLNRAHLEEDAGKSLHEDFAGRSGIDLNRAGVPLLEIVSEPDLRSAAEAGAYLRKLHTIVLWIDICDGRMAEGSMRCDANLSLRPIGSRTLGERCEIKNLNSFRFVEKALMAEARRQAALLESGQRIRRETMLYDEQADSTRAMRGKESSDDYRYFPDPDLLPVLVEKQWIDREKSAMPELPEQRIERLRKDCGLSAYDASVLTANRETADYYEKTLAICGDAKLAANWVMGDLSALLNEQLLTIDRSPVSADSFGLLLLRIADGTISGKIAKTVLAAIWKGEGECDDIIEKSGLKRISDSGELEQIVASVLKDNATQADQYRAGKTKVLGFLVGQVMKASNGQADPPEANRILREHLDAYEGSKDDEVIAQFDKMIEQTRSLVKSLAITYAPSDESSDEGDQDSVKKAQYYFGYSSRSKLIETVDKNIPGLMKRLQKAIKTQEKKIIEASITESILLHIIGNYLKSKKDSYSLSSIIEESISQDQQNDQKSIINTNSYINRPYYIIDGQEYLPLDGVVKFLNLDDTFGQYIFTKHRMAHTRKMIKYAEWKYQASYNKITAERLDKNS